MQTRDLVLVALFAALIAVLGVFPPLMIAAIGVPVTAQSLGPMLAGGLLGAKRGGLSVLLFLALVAVGLPLLSGGRGGLAVFLGPSAGYLVGFAAGAFVTGLLAERAARSLTFPGALLATVVGGVAVVHLCGVPGIAFVSDLPLLTALAGSAAFMPGDLVKAVVAALAMVALQKAYPLLPVHERRARS